MNKGFFSLFLFTLTAGITFAQTPSNTPAPQSSETQSANSSAVRQQLEPSRSEQERGIQSLKQTVSKSSADRSDEETGSDSRKVSCSQCPRGSRNLRVSKETAEIISPDKDDLAEYRQFLKQKNTGMVRLISDKGCGENSLVLKSDNYCAPLTDVPGFGSSFSFRTGKYVLGRFADVVYRDKKLYLFGSLTLGFMFNAGHDQITGISQSTKGMNVLFDYAPPTRLNILDQENEILTRGLIVGGVEYKKSVDIEPGQTFGLRSIAFDLERKWFANYPSRFNLSALDERKDVIIAVQIVRIEENNMTLIWKELQRKDAPKIMYSIEKEKEFTNLEK